LAAEAKPDFSGEYVLNPHASTLGAGADAVRSAVLRIEHREPMVRCQATFAFDSKTFEYLLERVSDGREIIDQKEPTTVSSLHWEGNALVFMDRTKGPDSELTMSWRYELLEGRRLLRAVEHIRGDGREQDNVWVFERR
jgi:hypothetical protein